MDIIKALKLITKDFTQGFSGSTLAGWVIRHDDKGRPLNCDPNYQWGESIISGKSYYFIRCGWLVKIYNEPTSYGSFNGSSQLHTVDLEPEYIKNK